MQTFSITSTHEDGKKVTRYPLASVVIELKPLTKVAPSSEITPHRQACDKAFALDCRYFGGCDLMEEMVAARFWPLGKV